MALHYRNYNLYATFLIWRQTQLQQIILWPINDRLIFFCFGTHLYRIIIFICEYFTLFQFLAGSWWELWKSSNCKSFFQEQSVWRKSVVFSEHYSTLFVGRVSLLSLLRIVRWFSEVKIHPHPNNFLKKMFHQ